MVPIGDRDTLGVEVDKGLDRGVEFRGVWASGRETHGERSGESRSERESVAVLVEAVGTHFSSEGMRDVH